MYNISSFYQSALWQHINEYIYHKPVIYIILYWKKHQCIIHDKKIWPINIYRAQILGISWERLKSENISSIKSQIKLQVRWICIYIQFWISDKISDSLDNSRFPNKSIRENMPSASTYIYTQTNINALYEKISKSHKTHIKKAISRSMTFDIWDVSDSQTFYDIWKQTAWTKGFGIFSQKKFEALTKYIYDHDCGKIFLAKLDWQIIWWAVCLFLDIDSQKVCIYLYGMTDRSAGNIGTNQFLHREIIKRCHDNYYDIYDFLGISGKDDGENHHLAWVTKFKLWFGWETQYIIWSKDLVNNKLLYYIYNLISR